MLIVVASSKAMAAGAMGFMEWSSEEQRDEHKEPCPRLDAA
jgi:hypothetical protein